MFPALLIQLVVRSFFLRVSVNIKGFSVGLGIIWINYKTKEKTTGKQKEKCILAYFVVKKCQVTQTFTVFSFQIVVVVVVFLKAFKLLLPCFFFSVQVCQYYHF